MNEERPQRPDAIVVGAGLSGLTAARELAVAGLEVLVLEARDRPGGRTQAAEIGGVTIDLGGEWVDAAHAEIRKLAGDLGIRLHPFERKKENARWYVRGALYSEMPLSDRDAEVYRRMNEAIVEVSAGADLDAPWKNAPEEDPSIESWLRREGMGDEGVHVIETLVSSCGSTVPLDRMSFYSYAVKVATRGGPGKGNEYRVEGGAGSIAAALADDLGERVRYSSPVTDIRRDGGGVEVRWTDKDGPGAARARRVVLALPFTCYRDLRFDPEPPGALRRMALTAAYGVVRKTFFVFDEPVDATTFAVTDTPLGYCAATQPSGGPDGEARGVVSFSAGRPLLPELGLPAEERGRRAVARLDHLYDLPEPVEVVEKVWPEEYWTRGSYMIMSPGDMADFGRAMGGSFGGVHLAGAEGVAAAPSFMNSAVKAGLRAGREVVEALASGAARGAGGARSAYGARAPRSGGNLPEGHYASAARRGGLWE